MSDQPTQNQPQQVYGFIPKKRHFIWRNPEEVAASIAQQENEQKNDRESGQENKPEDTALTIDEAVEAVRELGMTAPTIAKEVLRLLTEKEQQSEPSAGPQAGDETPAPEPTAIVVSPAVHSLTEAAPPAIVEVGPRSPKSPRRKKRRARPRKPEPAPPMSRLARHQSQCGVCGSDVQDEIDQAFVSWENVDRIADDYEIDRRAIYRHAHATGLFAKRDLNIRRALGRIIHEADRVAFTPDTVVRAIKILTHVNAHGEWVQPPTQIIFTNASARPANAPAAAAAHAQGDTPCKPGKRLKR